MHNAHHNTMHDVHYNTMQHAHHNIMHNVHHHTMHNTHHNIMHNVHHNISDTGGDHVIKRVTKKINIHRWHFSSDDAELSKISLYIKV